MLINLVAVMEIRVDGRLKKPGVEYAVPPRAAFVHCTSRPNRGPIAELKSVEDLKNMMEALSEGEHTPMLEPLEHELRRLLKKEGLSKKDIEAAVADISSLEVGVSRNEDEDDGGEDVDSAPAEGDDEADDGGVDEGDDGENEAGEGAENGENEDGAEGASDASDDVENLDSVTDIRDKKKAELVDLAADLGLEIESGSNKDVYVDAIAEHLGV